MIKAVLISIKPNCIKPKPYYMIIPNCEIERIEKELNCGYEAEESK